LKYGQKKDEIYGVLFDSAWLWEEYLGIVLKESFNHYLKGRGKRWKLFDTGQQIIPDYLSKDFSVVADAKYILLDKQKSYRNEEDATAIYYKTITYMYRWNAKIGLLLHPVSDSDSVKISRHQIIDTEGCVVKAGFPIPKDAATFNGFSSLMRMNEELFRAECNKLHDQFK
jgi:5-methylcytosine-specific restriction endonuclease McrBC regulatory subunit McrC